MKKIFKGYYIASGILLLIGITDFWHYARVGQNLLAHYEGAGIIQKLVHNNGGGAGTLDFVYGGAYLRHGTVYFQGAGRHRT